MKRSLSLAMAFLALFSLGLPLNATSASTTVDPAELARALTLHSIQNVINWKVGDSLSYDVSMPPFGKLGTMVKSVTKDEGEALWMKQDISLSIQREVVEVLLRKADGKILKMIRNGQEQEIPDDRIEIISQEYTEVTVPAGTFKALHIVAKSQRVSHIEAWINPRDTAMDGTLKQLMTTQFGTITMALTGFNRIP